VSAEEAWTIYAFHELGSNRAIGMTVGPIPEHAVSAYADRYGLDHWSAQVFTYLIRKLDNAFLKRLQAKHNSA